MWGFVVHPEMGRGVVKGSLLYVPLPSKLELCWHTTAVEHHLPEKAACFSLTGSMESLRR